MTVLANARVVTPGGVLSPGWVRVGGSRLESVAPGHPPPASGPVEDLAGAWLVPGFVDIHVHGGGGASMSGGGRAHRIQAAPLPPPRGTPRPLDRPLSRRLDIPLAGGASVPSPHPILRPLTA